MNQSVRRNRLAIAAIGLLAIALVGIAFMPRPTNTLVSLSPTDVAASPTQGTVTGSLTPDPAPSKTIRPTTEPLSTLSPGLHSTATWQPRLRFIVGPGWRLLDGPVSADLVRVDGSAAISLVNDAFPLSANSFGYTMPHRAADLVEALTEAPGNDLTARPDTLGGWNGWRIEGRTGSEGAAFVIRFDDGIPLTHGLDGEISMIALDGPVGQTIVVHWFGEEAQKVVESFRF